MPVVVGVLYNGCAVLRDAGCHKLADHAAEVGGHQHLLKPFHPLLAKFRIDEAQELREFSHGAPDVFDRESQRKNCTCIEILKLRNHWSANSEINNGSGHEPILLKQVGGVPAQASFAWAGIFTGTREPLSAPCRHLRPKSSPMPAG